MANMDTYVTKGKSDVQDKLKKATDDVQRMGEEFQETKKDYQECQAGWIQILWI